jgi:hypothetical protein
MRIDVKNRYLIVLLFLFGIILLSNKYSINQKKSSFKFSPEVYNFGKIIWSPELELDHKFELSDVMLKNLKVDTILSECGCTPYLLKSNVEGNEVSNFVIVKYIPISFGMFQKSLFVYYNGFKHPQELMIKGEIIIKAPNT